MEDNRGTGQGRISCRDLEAVLAEYAEASLPQSQRQAVEQHLAACATCTETLRDMRLALVLAQHAEAVVVPPRLVPRILEQTTGKLSWWEQLRLWVRPALDPRFALGVAMALISSSMLLRASGADLSRMSLAAFHPAGVYVVLDRQLHLAKARAVKYWHDLRIFYEIQTQLQGILETATPAEEPSQPERPSRKPARRLESQQAADLATLFLSNRQEGECL